jgi:hypothetical protein
VEANFLGHLGADDADVGAVHAANECLVVGHAVPDGHAMIDDPADVITDEIENGTEKLHRTWRSGKPSLRGGFQVCDALIATGAGGGIHTAKGTMIVDVAPMTVDVVGHIGKAAGLLAVKLGGSGAKRRGGWLHNTMKSV